MTEQTFRSPGFFEQEIDLSARKVSPAGTPAGVIGTAEKGPAFVPVTVGSFADFETKFGTLDTNRFGPYAVREFLKHKTALTYTRVLGAGANETAADIANTVSEGTVKNAGFVLSPSNDHEGRHVGAIQFLVAQHTPPANESAGFPVFTDNNSFFVARDDATETVDLVRAAIMMASGTKLEILDNNQAYSPANTDDDEATIGAIAGTPLSAAKYFKLCLSSSADVTFGNDDAHAGIRILTASLDPNDGNYISKVLNTDPLKFQQEEHLLYLDYAVEHDLAPATSNVAILSGTANTSSTTPSTDPFRNLFGRFDTRFQTPKTTKFISQPYGKQEFNLFHFETISDGAYANNKFKVSIANLRASTDPNSEWGTFEVQVRAFDDTDASPQVVERYPECSLNPNSDRYVARQIGDKKVYFDFDQENPDERRLVIQGKYPNVSQRIRIHMDNAVEVGEVPQSALPFGFRGLPVLKTSDSLTDTADRALVGENGVTLGGTTSRRITGVGLVDTSLPGAIVPPIPHRFKVTRGAIKNSTSPGWVGETGTNERVDGRLYWGIKTTRLPLTGTVSNAILNTNVSSAPNPLIEAYTKFQGIEKLDTLVTGSGADEFCSNKFSLSKVAFYNADGGTGLAEVATAFTGSGAEHMLEASYIRNGAPDASTYTVSDGISTTRFTMASLVHKNATIFNRFTPYAKFTNVFYGGFDGVNILDENAFYMKDRALSSDTGGGAVDAPNLGLAQVDGTNQSGKARLNNGVASMKSAVAIMTDPMSIDTNILCIPGIRDSYVTDYALERVRDYSQAIYVLDLVKYDESGNRLYDDSLERVDVRETSEQFESRALDNSYGATFFPDVSISDPVNNQVVGVPSSVAAMGAFAFNDKIAYPWFAPAGMNRGALEFVTNVEARLSAEDRDTLYDARINPVAVFPRVGFVIFGQKSLQMQKSALDRINVRRLLLEVKRQISGVAAKLLFEPNTPQTHARFITQVTPLLGMIQAQSGIEQFKVIMDGTNNTAKDVAENRLNGRVIVVPTRAVEFIAVDFIVTNSGVSFA